nr:liquid facets [Hymenolepis microstoma]
MMPLQRHIKNVVRNYTEAERKVREATSNDPWGPSSTLMSEIADRTYNVIAFTEIMQMIWRRLNDKSKNWRHVYKALILLDYIIKTGSDKVAVQCRENIHAIETLMDFYYVEEGKDVGNSVREKARSLNALLRDEERLQEERAKALLARERLMHGGALGTSGPSAYSPPSMPGFGRSASSYGDERRPSSQPSFSGVGGIPSDLDSAQPQSYTEEQLQLQLALAISREEHERELQKRHEEEAKEALKLQMVLEQSKREEQNRAVQTAASSLLSDAGPSSSTTAAGNGGGLFSLIDTSLSAAPANMPDPWSTIAPSVPTTSNENGNSTNHTLVPPGAATSASPFDTPAADFITPAQVNNTNSALGGDRLSLVDSLPWSPKDALQPQQLHTVPVANNNPWATLDPLEPAFPSTSAPSQNGNGNGNVSGRGDSTPSASSNAASANIPNSSGDSTTTTTATTATPTRKRTPADFLGDHKDLVDLEKLVDRNPELSTTLASTNPFATSTRPLTGHSTNPFSANQPRKPSLNQLSSAAAVANGAPMALMGGPVNRSPSAFTTFTGYGVAQLSHPLFNPGQSMSQGISTPTNQAQSQPQQSLNPFF